MKREGRRDRRAGKNRDDRAGLAGRLPLREQMRKDGPQAVAALLNSIPESSIRQILFALVVMTERVEEEKS
jgi:hypothetical protein